MNKKKDNGFAKFIACIIIVYVVISLFKGIGENDNSSYIEKGNNIAHNSNTLYILSSYENQAIEDEVEDYARSIGKKVHFDYMGDLDIVDELNLNSTNYDAVWISNSMWLYMLNNPYLATNSKSISVSPVVFGVKKSKAEELGLTSNSVTNDMILNLIKENKIKYVMSSVTQTNTGATAYLGFLSSLAGNPEVLTEEMLNDENLQNNLISLFSGVERVSGDDDFLQQMFLKSDDYEAVIAAESSLIDINKELVKKNKEPLYLIYPTDGVAINDSTFGFISNVPEKEELFLDIQGYLLSKDGQMMLENNGVRTWYGGVNSKANKKLFNPKWGIDTNKYLNVTRFPSKSVITSAINLYIEKFRKPTHVVFCLDYSGSMYGDGYNELVKAMNYILKTEEAGKDKLQFTSNDKITVIPFSSKVNGVWNTDDGSNTQLLLNKINTMSPGGSTALYDAIIEGLNVLNKEDNSYTKTIIAMTDGAVNVGSYNDLEKKYKRVNRDIPIYSITFGNADESQLIEIANLSNAKVFDGRNDLLKAFKEVRGYN